MALTQCATYLKGLGDLYIKADKIDDPAVTVDSAEDVDLWTGVGVVTVAASQVHVLQGVQSIRVTSVGAAEGVEWSPTAGSADYSAYEDLVFLMNLYPVGTDTVTIVFEEGANSETFTYDVTLGSWNRILLDLSSPDSVVGAVDWSAIDTIKITMGTGVEFYVDGMYFFTSMANTEREMNVRLGCLQEIGLDTSEDTVELKCSDNEVVESDIISTTITLSATLKDYDPEGLSLLSGGNVTTDSVTKLTDPESFTVPSSGAYTYTLENAANLKIGSGYGAWVYRTNSGCLLQQSPDSTFIPTGYYYINPATGELTFNESEAGVAMMAVYDVVTSGRTLEIPTSRTFLEFALQFQVKGSNSKKALLFFPKLKSASFAPAPEKEDYWGLEFEAKVLKDTTSGKYYEMHIVEE